MTEHIFGQGNQQPQQPIKMQIDPSQLTDVKCKAEDCDGDTFGEVLKFKKLTALLSPTGKDALIPMKFLVCLKCGQVLDVNNL